MKNKLYFIFIIFILNFTPTVQTKINASPIFINSSSLIYNEIQQNEDLYENKKHTSLAESSIYKNSLRILVLVVIVALVLLIISVPLLFSYYGLSNFIEFKKIYMKKKINFWLNNYEKSEFKVLNDKKDTAIKIIKNTQDYGVEESVHQNEDGSFNSETKEGKDLNMIIKEQENILFECNQKLSRLQLLPEEAWTHYNKTFANFIAYILAFFTWVITSFMYIYINFDSIEIGLKSYFQFPFIVFESFISKEKSIVDAISAEVWVNMLFIVGVTILSFFIGRLIGWSLVNINNKKPPTINLNNVDLV